MLKIISLGVMMTILLSPALAQQRNDSSTAKSKTAATTGSPNRIVKFVAPGVIGDSYITEDKFGNVGIGTATPTSPLTVQGMIEITLGGLRFPDGSVQTSAPVTKVFHNSMLTGDGTAASPLGVAVPLNLNGTGTVLRLTGTGTTLNVESTGNGRDAIRVKGGNSATTFGGAGVASFGGDSSSDRAGGTGLAGIGGRGGSNSDGGRGVEGDGGPASGAGNESGVGIIAFPGLASNGATTGKAGSFLGNVEVLGTLSKAGGSFKIDHPLDPENKYLSHSFVESPDMMNIYNGNITTDSNGRAVIELPEWFDSLNRDFRYQLTVMGQFAQAIVAEKVKGNRFTIQTSVPGVEVSWQVTGVRQDAWANKNRILVEEVKSEKERGLYLHPQAFGKTEERGVAQAHQSERMRQNKQHRETEQSQQPPK